MTSETWVLVSFTSTRSTIVMEEHTLKLDCEVLQARTSQAVADSRAVPFDAVHLLLQNRSVVLLGANDGHCTELIS